MGFSYNTWGGSWGTSWGNSWGAVDGGVTPPPQAAPIPAPDRGFDETLRAFAIERRRQIEEREVIELLGFEAEIIIRALKGMK